MVKFHESTFAHAHPFETVTLAYFLRYPNPYSTHVLSTDTIARHFDPATQTLYTARLHLKRSKIPSALLKLLPRSWLGASAEGTSQTYILERSIVDIKDGVMVTESRNLDLTGVLKVVERQLYRRPGLELQRYFREGGLYKERQRPGFRLALPEWRGLQRRGGIDQDETEVSTKVELISVLGEGGRMFRRGSAAKAAKAPETGRAPDEEESCAAQQQAPPQKMGFFRSWSTASIQKSIEAIGLRRTERAVPNSKKGMNIVLDRLRKGGLVAVLEGMRQDREMAFAVGEAALISRYRGVSEED